jgi:predicted Zn-dependent protease
LIDRCFLFLLALPAALAAGSANAAPYTPIDDSVVLERLPEKSDPALAELKRLRADLAAKPSDLQTAVQVARRSIVAARSTADPRFMGQAQAALAPWWASVDAPAPVLLLRATIRQSQHDFTGALADLDRLIASHPADGQALLTRATIHTVQGRYADALRDCTRLARLASPLVTATCAASAASVSGESDRAYRALTSTLARSRDDRSVRAWAFTLAAEIAARRGDASAADAHFREAIALDPRDTYARSAYADFLLDARRPRDVVALLEDQTRNDPLLLRLALAEQRLPDRQVAYAAHRRELAARFAAIDMRGDLSHLREQSRFQLEIEKDARTALALALRNWETQREPADLRMLAAAAGANSDKAALAVVSDWLAATRLEDLAVAALMAGKAR